MLEVRQLNVSYGDAQALWDISLKVGDGEIVTVVGPNGAGKTTLVSALAGIVPAQSGEVILNGVNLRDLPAHQICHHGVAIVPEGRRLFPGMSVTENLDIGAYRPDARLRRREMRERIFGFFPVLRERSQQRAGTLSGGEQQMLAVGRALMALPRLLLLDEPSLGLAPLIVDSIYQILAEINQDGVSILVVEQHVAKAFEIATRGYVIEEGWIIKTGPTEDLMRDPHVKRAYLALVD